MSEWIKCSDQMPVGNFASEEFYVLVKQFTNPVTYTIEAAYYDGNYKFGKEPRGWWRFDEDYEPCEVNDVVAWVRRSDLRREFDYVE